MKIIHRTILAISILAIYACAIDQEQLTNQTTPISPPFEGMEPAFTEYSILNSEGKKITTNRGSKISIPPYSFLTESGDTIEGTVTLKFREYHKTIETFRSGIPMTYMAEGNTEYFESAGMFELEGEFENNPIQINPSKKINVALASNKTDNNYRFFKLKDDNQNWTYMGENEPVVNSIKKLKLDSLMKVKEELKPDYLILNYMSLADVYYSNNWSKLRNVKKNSFVKKFEEYGFSYLNSSNFTRVKVKGRNYPACMLVWENLGRKISNRLLNSKKHYSKLTKKSSNLYTLVLINNDNKKVELRTTLKVFIPIKHLISFSPKKWKEEKEEVLAQIRIEEERIKLEAECFREFAVNSFGIYNWDRLQKNPLAIQVKPRFNFGKDFEVINEVKVYYYTGTDNSIVKVSFEDELILSPSNSAKLFAILPGNELAIFENSDYQKIDFERLKNTEKEEVVFNFTNVGKVDSKEVLKELLKDREDVMI